mgnify:CR=1 FL=1
MAENDCYIGLPNYEYNPTIYKYGDVFGERVRLNMNDHNDISRWKSYKCRDDDWFNMKITLNTGICGYKTYTIRLGSKTHIIMARVVYKLYHPEWDITDNSRTNLIDHRNRLSLDNRIENLRILTNTQNQHNRGGGDGVGAYYDKKNRNWTASIRVDGKKMTKHSFKTKEAARAQYLEWKKEFHIIPE